MISNSLRDTALFHHGEGCPVIPVKENKAPYHEGWNRWFTEPQTEQEVNAEFANGVFGLGLLTWPGSPYTVLDFDGAHAEEAWRSTQIELPETAKNFTRSGFFHLIFRMPEGVTELKRQIRLVRANCDCKKHGKPKPCGVDLLVNGYACFPPTPGYREDPDHPLEDAVSLPREIIDLAKSQERTKATTTGNADGKIPQGERTSSLVSEAGTMRARGMCVEAIRAALHEENKSRCEPPLDDHEIENIIKSAGEWAQGEPKKKAVDLFFPIHFTLIEAKDLISIQEPETDWIWEGILPSGGLSLLVAKPKVGKTTLALNLAVAVAKGSDFLTWKTQQAPVIYLALEEKRGEVQKKLIALNVTDEPLYFHVGSAPAEAMKEVGPIIKQIGAKLLVIDVLQKFVRVKDLNDYAQVTRALEPIMSTAREEDCHILLTHHAGKADRPDGDDILGSTGLLGGVDTSINIKKRDKRRTFFTIQRYGQDVPETVIDLKSDGSLEAGGSREEVEVKETLPLIQEALEGGPLEEKQLCERVPKNKMLVGKGLRQLVEQKEVERTGEGKRGAPYTYQKTSPILL